MSVIKLRLVSFGFVQLNFVFIRLFFFFIQVCFGLFMFEFLFSLLLFHCWFTLILSDHASEGCLSMNYVGDKSYLRLTQRLLGFYFGLVLNGLVCLVRFWPCFRVLFLLIQISSCHSISFDVIQSFCHMWCAFLENFYLRVFPALFSRFPNLTLKDIAQK